MLGSTFANQPLTAVGSEERLVFPARDFSNGLEPRITDGTLAGTLLLADVYFGPSSSSPEGFVRSGGQIFFSANDGNFGRELHAVDLSAFDTFVLEPFGGACGAQLSGSGAARLGASVALEVQSVAGLATTFTFFSQDRTGFAFGDGCTQLLDQPGLLSTGTTDATGVLVQSLAVPNLAGLIGLEIYFQALVEASGGPLLGAFELSNGVEAVIGE